MRTQLATHFSGCDREYKIVIDPELTNFSTLFSPFTAHKSPRLQFTLRPVDRRRLGVFAIAVEKRLKNFQETAERNTASRAFFSNAAELLLFSVPGWAGLLRFAIMIISKTQNSYQEATTGKLASNWTEQNFTVITATAAPHHVTLCGACLLPLNSKYHSPLVSIEWIWSMFYVLLYFQRSKKIHFCFSAIARENKHPGNWD